MTDGRLHMFFSKTGRIAVSNDFTVVAEDNKPILWDLSQRYNLKTFQLGVHTNPDLMIRYQNENIGHIT